MNLKRCILLWTAVFAAVFLTADLMTRLCGLRFRVWVREPATLLIAAGAAAGLLQLLLRIPKKPVKITAVILWLAAAAAGGCYGFVILAFTHVEERTESVDGTVYVVETESALWDSWDYYYERYSPVFRSLDPVHPSGADD